MDLGMTINTNDIKKSNHTFSKIEPACCTLKRLNVNVQYMQQCSLALLSIMSFSVCNAKIYLMHTLIQ